MNENVDKTIELFDGEKEFLDMFQLILRKKGRKQDANKVYAIANNYKKTDYNSGSKNMNDVFGPLTKPEEDFFRLPPDVRVEVISELKDIPKLEVLIGAPAIGVDSEWRPQVSKW
jgi:hypothetical protein